MTKQEHELMLLMFARMRQMTGILMEVLTSRGILTGDDATAFSHVVHFDDAKTFNFVLQTWRDYQASALQSGVVTGLETEPPSAPKPITAFDGSNCPARALNFDDFIGDLPFCSTPTCASSRLHVVQ